MYGGLLIASKGSLLSAPCHFCQWRLSNCLKNNTFGHPISTGNGMTCCKERHSLLLNCFISFLGCKRKVGGVSSSIYKPLMVPFMQFVLWTTLNFHTKYQIWGSLSAQERGHYTIRGDIHCCWSVSQLSLDAKLLLPRGGASDSIKRLLTVCTMSFLSRA